MSRKQIFKLATFAFFALALTACNRDGEKLINALAWAGDHTALFTVIIVAATPFIAMIPVVGLPFSAAFAKIGIALMPVLKQVAEAVEQDTRGNRSVGEAAGTMVGMMADKPSSIVGKIPGAGLIANIAAQAVVRKVRRHKKRSRGNSFPKFL